MKPGQLLAVIGPVGAGKVSQLHSHFTFPGLLFKIEVIMGVINLHLFPAVFSPQHYSGGASSWKGCGKGQRWADVCLPAALGFSRNHSEQYTVRKGAAAPAIWERPQSLCAQKGEIHPSHSYLSNLFHMLVDKTLSKIIYCLLGVIRVVKSITCADCLI